MLTNPRRKQSLGNVKSTNVSGCFSITTKAEMLKRTEVMLQAATGLKCYDLRIKHASTDSSDTIQHHDSTTNPHAYV